MSRIEDKLPSIPQYFKDHVDPSIDLEKTPSIPCPFHNETEGKSFSYSKQLGICRCFGKCHFGGGVIELHKMNYHLKTKEEAKKSLCSLYNIVFDEELTFEKEEIKVDEKDVYRRSAYALSVNLARKPEDWIELDYILSKVPYDVRELEVFCAKHGHPITSRNNLPN